jgi:hypothetical protein
VVFPFFLLHRVPHSSTLRFCTYRVASIFPSSSTNAKVISRTTSFFSSPSFSSLLVLLLFLVPLADAPAGRRHHWPSAQMRAQVGSFCLVAKILLRCYDFEHHLLAVCRVQVLLPPGYVLVPFSYKNILSHACFARIGLDNILVLLSTVSPSPCPPYCRSRLQSPLNSSLSTRLSPRVSPPSRSSRVSRFCARTRQYAHHEQAYH